VEWRERLETEKFPISDERLKELALEIDHKFWKSGQEGGSTGTFVLATVEGTTVRLQVGNVGDSRVLACKNGNCLSLTTDHKPNDPLEARRIIECGGKVENNRVDGSLAVSRAFGDNDYKRGSGGQLNQKVIALADVTHCELTAGSSDFFLLACDGVFEGEFSNEEVIDYAKAKLVEEPDVAVTCGYVCEEAIARNSKDNISCMIVQVVGDPAYHKPLEVFPGPWTHPGHSGFRKAYAFMAKKGGISVGECLMKRYDYLSSKTRTDEEDKEMAGFKAVPETLKPGERVKWFNDYFDGLAVESAAAAAPGGPMGGYSMEQIQRLQLLQQHLGIPLSMIMELMSNQEEDRDIGE
jgi:protein phosphatase